ncbi:MAG: ImmA/IrrE family metallo-endopeptidase [Acutalibacteraceae bacterium]|nr:ImmA/IrrE family metallo-endopeptidase [Acutalibacteraceae bacterium]
MELNELYKIAEEKNVRVMDFSLPENKSVCIELDDGCFVGVDPAVFSSQREEKVVIAHELGHIQTGSFYAVGSDSASRCKQEAKAEKWTINKLVPLDELKKAIEKGYCDVQSLAEYFEVTEKFMYEVILHYRKKS